MCCEISYFCKNIVIFVSNIVLVKIVNIIYGGYEFFQIWNVFVIFVCDSYVKYNYVSFVWINYIGIYICIKCISIIC